MVISVDEDLVFRQLGVAKVLGLPRCPCRNIQLRLDYGFDDTSYRYCFQKRMPRLGVLSAFGNLRDNLVT